MRLGTGIVGVFQARPALLAQECGGALGRLGRALRPRQSAPPRTGSSKAGTRSPSKSRSPRSAKLWNSSRSRWRESAPRPASSLKRSPPTRIPIVLAALRGKMLELAVEQADGRLHQLPAARRTAPGRRPARRRGGRLRAPLPLLLPAGDARAGRAGRPLHVLHLHHGAGLHRVLQMARLGREDPADARRPGARAIARRRRPRRPGEADRADVHLRLARRR